jgi:hypothetical protein
LRKIYKNKIKNGKEVAELPFCWEVIIVLILQWEGRANTADTHEG